MPRALISALVLAVCLPATAAPDPEGAGKPPRPHKLVWVSKTGDWNRSLAIAPWGDVVSCSMWRLRLHARESGQILTTVKLPEGALDDALGFTDERTLAMVTAKGLHTLTLPKLGLTAVARFTAKAEVACVRGGLVAVGTRGGQVTVYRPPAAEPVSTVQAPSTAQALALSEDGERLAVGCDKGLIRVYDLRAGTWWDVVPAASYGSVGALAFSSDAKLLLADRPGFKVELRDLQKNVLLAEWRKGSWIKAARFLGARRVVVTGSDGLAIYAEGAKTTRPSYGIKGRVSTGGLAVGPDGRMLAVGDRQGTVALFSVGRDWKGPAAPFTRKELRASKPAPAAPAGEPAGERLAELAKVRRRRVAAPTLQPLQTEVRSFLSGPSTSRQTYFARLSSATIGGEFDTAGNEEVQFDLDVGSASRKLIRKVIDLPSNALRRFDFDAPWVELAPAKRFSLGVRVRDEDLTEWERITSTRNDLELAASDLKAQPTRHSLELETIRLTEYFFMIPKKVIIRGPTLELSLVSSPRRDTPDDAYRAELRRLLGDVVKTPLPNTSLAAHGVEERLVPLARSAMAAAGRSTHTYLRKTLPDLAQETHRLTHLAGDVGALHSLSLDLAALRTQLAAIPGDVRRRSTLSEDLLARADVLAKTEAPRDREGLDALFEKALELGASFDAVDRLPRPVSKINDALDTLLTDTDRARRGLHRTADLSMKFRDLQTRVRAALGD